MMNDLREGPFTSPLYLWRNSFRNWGAIQGQTLLHAWAEPQPMAAVDKNAPARLCQPLSPAFKNKKGWDQESCSDSTFVDCTTLNKQQGTFYNAVKKNGNLGNYNVLKIHGKYCHQCCCMESDLSRSPSGPLSWTFFIYSLDFDLELKPTFFPNQDCYFQYLVFSSEATLGHFL